ncbi:MAG: hypothetical protein GY822_31545 [Deltaproteobacteria bacterium]|nr:hypothetical protein [Deltaproteobacteria bacterium]
MSLWISRARSYFRDVPRLLKSTGGARRICLLFDDAGPGMFFDSSGNAQRVFAKNVPGVFL